MKINNVNSYQVNPYKKHIDKQESVKHTMNKDKLEISSAAKEMQSENKISAEREERVRALKAQVESGEYNIDEKLIAQKVIDFYKNIN